MSLRVVFDTNMVVSALIFTKGRLAWLRQHWRDRGCAPLISRATTAELVRVFGYPKFQLSPSDRQELLADYLPYFEVIELTEKSAAGCRDAKDQPFLNLAQSCRADRLVSGDHDLLALSGQTAFLIEKPEAYRDSVADSPASGQADPTD